jgi:hypothetical protein
MFILWKFPSISSLLKFLKISNGYLILLNAFSESIMRPYSILILNTILLALEKR